MAASEGPRLPGHGDRHRFKFNVRRAARHTARSAAVHRAERGAIRDGLIRDASRLATRSALDGSSTIAFAATLRWDILPALAVIVAYQGCLAMGTSMLSGRLSDAQLREMSAVSSLLIVGVGLKLLKIAPCRSLTICRRSRSLG